MTQVCLVDADTIVYRAALSPTLDGMARNIVDRMDVIEQAAPWEEIEVWLAGGSNFRYEVNPEYKANRKDKDKPPLLQEAREFMVTHYRARLASEMMEVDDMMLIRSNWYKENTNLEPVICAIDKDLLQIPGLHFNYDKEEWKHVEEFDGIRLLYAQALIGDRSDNIIGVNKIGPVKAARALSWCETEYELFETVLEMYNDDLERLTMNMRCLQVQGYEEIKLWEPPLEVYVPEVDSTE